MNDRLIVTARVQNTPFGAYVPNDKAYSFDISSDSNTTEVLENFIGLMKIMGYHEDSIKHTLEELTEA